MTNGWKAVCFVVAFVLLVFGATVDAVRAGGRPWRLPPLGVAAFVFPFLWDAIELATKD